MLVKIRFSESLGMLTTLEMSMNNFLLKMSGDIKEHIDILPLLTHTPQELAC
jgi:hypothetical protein